MSFKKLPLLKELNFFLTNLSQNLQLGVEQIWNKTPLKVIIESQEQFW